MSGVEGRCRFCGERRSLIKAHIIPEAFFRAIGTGKNAPLLVTDRQSVPYPKRAPIGVYDSNILCHDCERKFDSVDAYGTRTLLHTLRGDVLKPLVSPKHGVVGFQAHGINQEPLKRFFIATLWRASVSTQPFFDRVRLGAHYENLAKGAVVTGSPLSSGFGVALAGWLSPEGQDENIGFMDPFVERYDDVKTYRFPFGRFIAYMKVDQRPFGKTLVDAALGAQPILHIVRRDYSKSKDFAAMVRTAKRQYQNSLTAKARSNPRPRP